MTGTVLGTFINKVITYHQGPGDYFKKIICRCSHDNDSYESSTSILVYSMNQFYKNVSFIPMLVYGPSPGNVQVKEICTLPFFPYLSLNLYGHFL